MADPAVSGVARARRAGAGPAVQPGRAGKVPITGFFDPAVRLRLRRLALDTGTTSQALVAEALDDLFAKHGRAVRDRDGGAGVGA